MANQILRTIPLFNSHPQTMVQHLPPDLTRENSPFEANWFLSSVTEADLRVFWRLYQILDSVTLRVPEANKFSRHSKGNEVAFNEKLFLLGARLPL